MKRNCLCCFVQEWLFSQAVRVKRRPLSTSMPSTTAPWPNPGSWRSPLAEPCRRLHSEPGEDIRRTRKLPLSSSLREQRYFWLLFAPDKSPLCSKGLFMCFLSCVIFNTFSAHRWTIWHARGSTLVVITMASLPSACMGPVMHTEYYDNS